ncbi:MAG: hypothetical protein IKB92_03590, partial [Clostridia bacterium]|nr:hypothetical protein [Clostridia bacterium]
MKFVSSPNLPKNAAAVIVSADIPQEISDSLTALDIDIILSPLLDGSQNPIINHPDAGIVHINSEKFVCSPETYPYYKTIFKNTCAELICGNTAINGKYPDDAAYNVANTGKFAICNTKFTDKKVLEMLRCEIIDVPQGYA